MEEAYKEVYYDKYCPSCKYEHCQETDDPYYDCMSEPVNLYSHKPVRWEEKE